MTSTTSGTFPFSLRVWSLCSQIPAGKVCSYGDIAAALGSPGAVRAVGTAMSKNPLAPAPVPCHRVLSKGGGIGGFQGSK
jgi:O-6-methylguanine DNA methyltransferase